MTYSIRPPPKDLTSTLGRAWLQNISRMMIRQRVLSDLDAAKNTDSSLQILKSYQFNSDILRRSVSELAFEVWGESTLEAVTRYLKVYINDILQYTVTLTNAVAPSSFLIRGKIISNGYTGGDYLTSQVEFVTPGETIVVGVKRNDITAVAPVGVNEMVTFSIKAEGSSVNNTQINNFSIDYCPGAPRPV